ncbi:C40 family peptidase [Nocardia sp. CA-128927]|uniref:C40 family peptidase n=1 Tax=Nocardia sp. CA-128927 TaxID=3239975 RepID=UPI003D95271D
MALSLPVALILMLLIVIGADPAVSCAATLTPSVAGAAPESTGSQVAGLSDGQVRLARNGVAIGVQRRMPESVILAELMAQATESSFRNLANSSVPESLRFSNDGIGHDHDSVGPHQIRVSVHLAEAGSMARLMDPAWQINWFYDQAARLPGAARMSPADLAQAIEISGPAAYAGQLGLARQLYAMFANIDPASMPATGAGQPAAGCGSGGSGAPLTAAGPFGLAVIQAAQRWIGTPYVWGGGDQDGPTGGGFDCSGLTLYALYQASRGQLRLPHYTQAQQDHPSAQIVPFDQRAPGDLIFFTTPGSTDSHHVAILFSRSDDSQDPKKSSDLVLHAPQTGQAVTITPLSAWAGEHLDIRRYSPPTAASSESAGT